MHVLMDHLRPRCSRHAAFPNDLPFQLDPRHRRNYVSPVISIEAQAQPQLGDLLGTS